MNCLGCDNGNHENCLNYVREDGTRRVEPTTTWCACQHKVGGGHHDPTQCSHPHEKIKNGQCSLCFSDVTPAPCIYCKTFIRWNPDTKSWRDIEFGTECTDYNGDATTHRPNRIAQASVS